MAQFPALEAKQDELRRIFREAGPDSDLSLVTCIKGTNAEKLDRVKQLNREIDELKGVQRQASGRRGYETYNSSHYGDDHASGLRGGDTKAGEWLAAGLKGWTTSGTTNGGAFSPTQYSNTFWDRLAATSVGLTSGFTTISTSAHEFILPRLTADTAANWTAEAATITATDATADEIKATPRKLAALQVLSNEVVADSNPAVLQVSATQMIRSLALKLDLGFFEGSGTAPEIRGIKNVTGIQSVSMGTNGSAPVDLDEYAEAIGLLEEQNAHATAIVMHPRTWKDLLQVKEAPTGNNKALLQQHAGAGTDGVQRSIYGVPVFLSSQLSITETQGTATDASSAYIYQASEIVAVMREDTRLETDRSRLFHQDQTEVRAVMRADLVVPNPKAVVRLQGIIPAA
ncbi:phage major capsid protein [Streptomyces halobius]|uniref:Phage major capsid protein n=1 Tax=Streptomyces halobius TaxID=2879846 RepID=A0ABY4M661_9ACTN|nr:phage major capsid protein [Streptomyces halobius]UQA92668.1 phage major capsid protein [Streptomyces halobius]